MPRIQIVNGIYTDQYGDFRTSYPINMRPIPKQQGISAGYLKYNEGVTRQGTATGITRGGILWDGVVYRVMGQNLVRINENGTYNVIGTIAGNDIVTMVYSFDRLAIAANNRLYYYDKSELIEVTDVDLGNALCVEWSDGYFITTDGGSIVVTELTDPTQIDPLKYGSSEVDPDPINRVIRLRNEIYAVNRYSVEAFQNIGGSGFPYQVIRGAQMHKGSVATHMSAVFLESIAFVGGGRDDSIAVWLGNGGIPNKISTQEIDALLEKYTQADFENSFVEVRTWRNHSVLMVHLPDRTLCYDAIATAELGSPAWYQLNDGLTLDKAYTPRHFVYAYGKWLVGSAVSGDYGYIDENTAHVWGKQVAWQFGTPIIYNESAGAVVSELELVSLAGASATVSNSQIYTEYSLDGLTWSQRRYINAGRAGKRDQRLRWMRQGKMTTMRLQRFGGTSTSPITCATLNARIEPLVW